VVVVQLSVVARIFHKGFIHSIKGQHDNIMPHHPRKELVKILVKDSSSTVLVQSLVTHLVQFTAGMAYLLARACSRSLRRLSPVTTPGGTMSVRELILSGTMFNFLCAFYGNGQRTKVDVSFLLERWFLLSLVFFVWRNLFSLLFISCDV